MQANEENGLKPIIDESEQANYDFLKNQVDSRAGWQLIGGVWYFNGGLYLRDPSKGAKEQPDFVAPEDGRLTQLEHGRGSIFLEGGNAQSGGVTPDGRTVDATGARGGSIP